MGNFMENVSSSSEGEGTGVGSLYTYGSPMVAEEPGLTNPARADGCFPGFWIVNQREGVTIGDIDLVAWLLRGTRYRHTKMATLKLFENRLGERKPSETFPCGWEQGGGLIPSLPEHFIWVYSRRGRDTPNNEVPGLSVLTSVGYDISYNTRVEQVAQEVRSKGWGLVNSAVTGFGWLRMCTRASSASSREWSGVPTSRQRSGRSCSIATRSMSLATPWAERRPPCSRHAHPTHWRPDPPGTTSIRCSHGHQTSPGGWITCEAGRCPAGWRST